jgi:Nucleotidyl transferase AbiEii toxin, Type IV TA system
VNYAAMRQHVMLGIVRRLARVSDAFVLRGGLLTALWIAPRSRPTRDLDFVGDFAFDLEATQRRFAPALAIDLADDVRIDPASLRASPMWLDSEFPGVRLGFRGGLRAIDQELSIDVGFNDPLVPAAVERVIDGDRIRVVRPETQLAWKLHALAEMTTSWRPKDLADASLILAHVPLVDHELVPAITAAFQSRGFSRASATGLFEAAHWPTKTSRLRWDKHTTPLAETVAAIRTRLAPIFDQLPAW